VKSLGRTPAQFDFARPHNGPFHGRCIEQTHINRAEYRLQGKPCRFNAAWLQRYYTDKATGALQQNTMGKEDAKTQR